MNELISILIGTLFLSIIFILIREYNELVRHEFRFKFFALRDKLAMLVVTKKLDEESWEYQHIVETLNFHISAVEHMSIMRIALLLKYHTSPKEEQQVKTLSKQIGQKKEIVNIVIEYFSTISDLIKKNNRVQIPLIRIMGKLLNRTISADPHPALSALKSRKIVFEEKLSAV